MDDLKEFRVSAWMIDGVMVPIERAIKKVKSFAAAGAAAAAIGIVVATMTVGFEATPAVLTGSAISAPGLEGRLTVEDELARLSRSMDAGIASFHSMDVSDISEAKLARARRAIAAMNALNSHESA